MYMAQYTISSLVHIMACRLFGDKPLFEAIMVYCLLDCTEHISMKFCLKFQSFNSRKCIVTYRLPKWWPSCLGLNHVNVLSTCKASYRILKRGCEVNIGMATDDSLVLFITWGHPSTMIVLIAIFIVFSRCVSVSYNPMLMTSVTRTEC